MKPIEQTPQSHKILSTAKSILLVIFIISTPLLKQQLKSNTYIQMPQKSKIPGEEKFILRDIPNLQKFSSYSKLFLSDLILDGYNRIERYRPSEKILQKYPVTVIGQRYYIGALIKVNREFSESELLKYGVLIGTKAGDIISAKVPIENLERLSSENGIDFIQIDEPLKPQLDQVRIFTFTNYVHQGYQLPKPYTGKNVIVGIIDRGFDFTHPVFWDTSLTTYRVKRVWLMENDSGNPPPGYSYGTEVVGERNIRDLLYDFKDESHGTHVAGIAAGGFSGSGTHTYKGMAPESELVLISAGGRATNFIDGINYIFNYASSINKPAVVNLSWGGYIGPRDGTSLFDKAVDFLVGPGKIVVGSAGNEGSDPVHLTKDFTSTDTLVYTFVEFYSPLWGKTAGGKAGVDIWGDKNTSFSVFVGIYNTIKNSWEDYTPVISSNFNALYVDTLYDDDLFSPDLCFVTITAVDKSPLNDKPNIQIYFDNTDQDAFDENDYVVIGIIGRNTNIHAWLARIEPCYFTNKGYGYPVKSGDVDYTIMEIGGTGKSIISVGAFTTKNEYKDINGITRRAPFYTGIGEIAPFSSRGPTVDGRIKPDITAPGNVVVSALSRFDSRYGLNSKEVVSWLTDETNIWLFGALQGTSMSAPVVTGMIALMLEVNPQLDQNKIKQIIQTTAITDDYTGTIPNNTWGWGKVNTYSSLRKILSPTIQLTWISKSPMPTSRSWAPAVEYNGKIYVIGGCSSNKPEQFKNPVATLEVYDPVTDTWQSLAPMPSPRIAPVAVALNGEIYVIGGFDPYYYWSANPTVEIYNIATNTWRKGPRLPYGCSWAAGVVLNGKIYVLGGVGYHYYNTTQIFDPSTNTWTLGPSFTGGRYLCAATTYNGKIYLIGGDSWETGSSIVYNDIQEYDPRTNTWTSKTPMPTPWTNLSAIAHNGKIYVFGGNAMARVYDISSDSWQDIISNHDSSDAFSVCLYNNTIYRFGGGGWGPTKNIVQCASLTIIPVKENTSVISSNFALHQNYPNPFNSTTTIEFEISERASVNLIVYDILGREIEKLVDKELEPGRYKVNFNVVNLPSGVYFYTLKTAKFTQTNKMLLIK